MADLITLSELKAARGETGSDNDTKYTWMIGTASSIIRNYTGRDFGAAQLTEERSFQYDGSGYLDIDDASTVTDVKLVVPNSDDFPLDAAYQWFPQPARRDDSPVYTYIVLSGVPATPGFSPEMGFARNLDVYYSEHRVPTIPTTLKVTATWGWPTVPPDVKQAAIWTIEEWISRSDGEGLTSEAIEGYARSWGRGTGQTSPALAIPDRARDVLSAYEKIQI